VEVEVVKPGTPLSGASGFFLEEELMPELDEAGVAAPKYLRWLLYSLAFLMEYLEIVAILLALAWGIFCYFLPGLFSRSR
jgi:hypothetical protein